MSEIDSIISRALTTFADRALQRPWHAKEADWVSLFAFGHLVPLCRAGTILYDPAQIGVEVGVGQPPGRDKPGTRRDIVIWPAPGGSCWDQDWNACTHPLAILEWKVHRPGRRNQLVPKERQWLRDYSVWQPGVISYAIQIEAGTMPRTIAVDRFQAEEVTAAWWTA